MPSGAIGIPSKPTVNGGTGLATYALPAAMSAAVSTWSTGPSPKITRTLSPAFASVVSKYTSTPVAVATSLVGALGGVVSTVNPNAAEGTLETPALLITIALMLWPPSASGVAGM
ncbi:hypothetical protein D3C87_1153860 [compost metagenome]